MAKYVDGFVLPVPRDKIEAYRKIAASAGEIWMDHGALAYVECVAEDVRPGELTSFPQAVQLQPEETVVFAWIVFASRADRDRINAAVMQDPRMSALASGEMPFDGKRMIFGGFETLVAY
jgi:uncharacterized protein YbaA (DUF1428 family)